MKKTSSKILFLIIALLLFATIFMMRFCSNVKPTKNEATVTPAETPENPKQEQIAEVPDVASPNEIPDVTLHEELHTVVTPGEFTEPEKAEEIPAESTTEIASPSEIVMPEEPEINEPLADEPLIEEKPSFEEEIFVEEPATEEPATEEPTIEEPAIEEPAIEEPAIEEPAIEEPVPEEAPLNEPKDAAVEEPKEEAVEESKPVDPSKEPVIPPVTVGEYIKFGRFEQDNDTYNGMEEIEWRVLEVKDSRVLVISKYGLDARPYNDEKTDVTWETCTLRSWLNNEFLNQAFTEEENARIPTVTVLADKTLNWEAVPGNSTEDKIFLLSVNEANKYFSSDKDRVCKPTKYAEAQGAFVSPQLNSMGNSWWLLRSQGDYQDTSTRVDFTGSIDNFGHSVHFDTYTVRPALWIEFGEE